MASQPALEVSAVSKMRRTGIFKNPTTICYFCIIVNKDNKLKLEIKTFKIEDLDKYILSISKDFTDEIGPMVV